jgi:hypothetical protein
MYSDWATALSAGKSPISGRGMPESKIDHELLRANDAIRGAQMNPADFRAIDVRAGGRMKIDQKAREYPVYRPESMTPRCLGI